MDFESIEEMYAFVEMEMHTLNREWELSSAIKRLSDKSTDESIKQKLKWECFVFDFYIHDGLVKPVHSQTTEDGKTVYQYPAVQDFGSDGFDYIKDRAMSVNNEFLRSRYNHILWASPKKHYQYAKTAVDSYLAILKTSDCNKEEKRGGRDCFEILKGGLRLAAESKYRLDDFKGIIKYWLFEKRRFPNHLKIFLLNHVLDTNIFQKNELTGALELVQKIGAAHSKKTTDYFFIKEIYETGLKLAQKHGTDTKIWNKRIADAIVKMADHRMDDETRMVPLNFLKEAIPYYKSAGMDKKVRDVERRYFELKKELKLSKFEVPLDEEAAEALSSYFNQKVTALMQEDSKDIYGYLLSGRDIFPSKKWLQEMNKNPKNSFLDFVTTMRFDINNNVSKDKEDSTSKEIRKVYENYHWYLQFQVFPLLHRIFVEGIRKGKINFPTMVRFFMDHTWLGQELTETDSGGDIEKYNWMSLIAPALLDYIVQMEGALRSTQPFTNFVMPIDSLTLKFEGALRDFCRLLKISTTIAGKKNVLREKYIEELLAEEEVKKYFDENDLLFFKFLFVAKEGINLRNNIAHCFYRFSNYNFQIMHLLICAFLRLGKYRIRTTSG